MKSKNGFFIAGIIVAVFVIVGATLPAHAQICALEQECGDVDDSGGVTSSDALKVLRKAVGQPVATSCSCAENVPPPPTCVEGGIDVVLAPDPPVPAELEGYYYEAFDCEESEGGGISEGVDYTHCFRKADGSAWRIWNSGCGWLIGRVEGCSGFNDYLRTYAGSCGEEVPPEQLEVGALTTNEWLNNFGEPVTGVSSGPCTP